MTFSKDVITLGEGKVTDARQINNQTVFLISIDGAVIRRTFDHEKKSVSGKETVSYADSCYFAGNGLLELVQGTFRYVP